MYDSIASLSRKSGVGREAISALIDEHDIVPIQVGKALVVSEADMKVLRPILDKIRRKAEARRSRKTKTAASA